MTEPTEQETVNAVSIFPPDRDEGPIQSRDDILARIDGCVLKCDDDGRALSGEVEDFLNTANTSIVGRFFDRDERHVRWYYSIIARQKPGDAINDIATMMVGKRVGVIRGPVLIVKDCAMKHWDNIDKVVDVEEVGKTLWFYAKSGVSPEEEYGTRTLIRLLSEDEI